MSTSPESELPAFQQRQLAFTAHIRDPENVACPEDVPARRMAVYAELFFNNINDQLSGNFPVLREITADAHWHDLVRDFMRRHRSTTPLFTEVGQEFLAYLQDEREASSDDWPFMLELAHYEYVELAVALSTADDEREACNPNGDLLNGRPAVSSTAWPLTYQWPVHKIGPDFLPDKPAEEPTHLVVYRDRLDAVHFLEINAVTQRLLQLLNENPAQSGIDVLKTIAVELQHPAPDSVIKAGRELLEELRQRNVILGTRR
jgi:hypothetical protein